MPLVGYREKPYHQQRVQSTHWSTNAQDTQQLARNESKLPGPYMLRSTRPSYGLTFPEPEPRAFHQLLAERSYLLGVLQEENEKATQLLRKVQPLEEAIILTQCLQQHRILKKQLGWLRSRIKETTSQERSILKRLAHLSYEIQSQERWSQIQHERLQYFQSLNNYQYINPLMHQSMTLNPQSPEFHPQGYPAAYPVLLSQQFQPFNTYDGYFPPTNGFASKLPGRKNGMEEENAAERHFGEGPSEERSSEEHVTQHEDPVEKRERLQRPSVTHRSSSMNRAAFNILATNTAPLDVPREKRHSLAGLPGTDMIPGEG